MQFSPVSLPELCPLAPSVVSFPQSEVPSPRAAAIITSKVGHFRLLSVSLRVECLVLQAGLFYGDTCCGAMGYLCFIFRRQLFLISA
jgi:hypothetical protein